MKDVTMPKLSDTMTEGTVVAWRKEVGAKVERGEVIAEVETDKATMELEAFASGVLLEIRVGAGETVSVGTVIGLIGAEGERPAKEEPAKEEPAKEEPAKEEPAKEEPAKEEPAKEEPAKEEPAKEEPAKEESEKEEPERIEAEDREPVADGDVLAAPVVRRRARELDIDLAALAGSGPGGRILLKDLEAAAANRQPKAGEPLSRMRAAIARTVSESWRTIPHFSVMVEVRMKAAEELLGKLREEGPKVSLTALLVKASAQALVEFPRLNASLREEKLVVHPEVNIGIVVRQGEGLLVPVVRGCEQKPLSEVAERAAHLVERARKGRLSDTELGDGTFAISNLGMYAVHDFVALILPPMAAVLAVGAVRDGVVVQKGELMAARLMSLTLSADHRIVDGVYAAEFLQELKRLLEAPEELVAG